MPLRKSDGYAPLWAAMMFHRWYRSIFKRTESPEQESAKGDQGDQVRTSVLAPAAVLLACGAGVSFWWWTQWARGRAEAESAAGEARPDPEVRDRLG